MEDLLLAVTLGAISAFVAEIWLRWRPNPMPVAVYFAAAGGLVVGYVDSPRTAYPLHVLALALHCVHMYVNSEYVRRSLSSHDPA